jgi:septal ring factor EnvC (AmiA/AmiB activator)
MKLKSAILVLALTSVINNANAELSSSDLKIAYNATSITSKSDAKQQQEIAKQLEILNSSIRKIESEIRDNKKDSKKVEAEIRDLEKNQKKIEAKLAQELDNFNNTTTTILRMTQIPEEMIVLQDAVQVQQKRTGTLAIFKKQLTSNIESSKASLSRLTANLEEQKQRRLALKSINNRLEAKKVEFRELRNQQKKVLSLPAEIRLKMQKNAVLLAQNLNLNSFLKSVKKTTVKTQTSMSNNDLPIDGKIIENFHDKDRITLLPVQGITIEGYSRGKIKAMHDGRVIYSGVFREYGHLVILEHQTGAHSLYAGFGKSILDVGDYVNAGDLMGFLPSEEEPSLYYEVRINNKAQNPKKWLKKDLNKA